MPRPTATPLALVMDTLAAAFVGDFAFGFALPFGAAMELPAPARAPVDKVGTMAAEPGRLPLLDPGRIPLLDPGRLPLLVPGRISRLAPGQLPLLVAAQSLHRMTPSAVEGAPLIDFWQVLQMRHSTWNLPREHEKSFPAITFPQALQTSPNFSSKQGLQ
mmetsp:Transcript_32672/g.57933  ORF Transcript_32672/g.57933 Transcript_32672/m.57933 type:complete len:160 (+) Transcript_32672:66-545(+)